MVENMSNKIGSASTHLQKEKCKLTLLLLKYKRINKETP